MAVLSSGTSRDSKLMVLMRFLALLVVRHSLSFKASSVPGKANPVADALSRFQFQRFRRLAPHRPCCDPSSSGSPRSLAGHLTDRCHFFLTQGLAPSTRWVYQSAQRRYIDFCRLDDLLSPEGALLPANEQTLMRFATMLADSFNHSSIKVYFSTVNLFTSITG